MAERTLSQMYFEDGIPLREVARKAGIKDHQGAVLHLRNPKTGEKEKLSIGMSEGVEKPKPKKELKKPKKKLGKKIKKIVKPKQKKKVASKVGVAKKEKPKQKTFGQRYDEIKALTKAEQITILKGFGLSWIDRMKLKYEDQRIRKIIELQDKNRK